MLLTNCFTSHAALRLLFKIAREYREVLENHVHYAFVINGELKFVIVSGFSAGPITHRAAL